MMSTIFEKIINEEIPAAKVFENERVIAIKDIAPKAPVHLLIISKKMIPSLQEANGDDFSLIAEMMQVAQQLAKEFHVENGYRLVTNIGINAGQTIFHLHFHLLGGCPLEEMC